MPWPACFTPCYLNLTEFSGITLITGPAFYGTALLSTHKTG